MCYLRGKLDVLPQPLIYLTYLILNHDVILTRLWISRTKAALTALSLHSLMPFHESDGIHTISTTLVQLRFVDCLPTKSSRFSETLVHLASVIVMEKVIAFC